MNTAIRIARLEALTGKEGSLLEFIAADQLDFDGQFEDALLSRGAGPLSFAANIAGVESRWSGVILAHEKVLLELGS